MRPLDFSAGAHPLSAWQIDERNRRIREMRKTHKRNDVAEAFGLCPQWVSVICRGLVLKVTHTGKNPNRRPCRFDYAEVRRRYADGESQRQLAEAFGVTPRSIARVVKGSISANQIRARQRHALFLTNAGRKRPGVKTLEWCPAEWRADYLAIRPKVGAVEARRLIEAAIANVARQTRKTA